MHHLPNNFFRALVCSLFLLCCASMTANAQFRANIQGTVSDPTGAVVPGATVTLTNNETSKTQTTAASDEGFYRFSGLAPGKYTITGESAGFKRQELKDIVVSGEDTQGFDIILTTGEIGETVTVLSGSVPLLETETGNIRGVITAEEVRRLPQVGRNPYELARTAPGVLGDTARNSNGNRSQNIPGVEEVGGGSNSGVFQAENQTQISANGQRVSSNNYLIDGVSVNSLGLGGAAVVTPNQESVKEVSVVTSTYSAEDGRNTGAQVKVVSQNGTNDFHGSAVFNYGSPKLNARNQFRGKFPTLQDNERVNQYERKFAGSLGGPIYLPRFGEGGPAYFSGKNKLFFFFSYEALRRSNTAISNTRFVETPEFRDYVKNVRPNGLAAQLYSLPGIEPRIVATGLTSCGGDPARRRVVNGRAGLSFDIGSINRPLGQGIDERQDFDGIPDVTCAQVALPSTTNGNQYNTRIDYNRGNDQFAVSTYFTKQNNLSPSNNGRPFEDTFFRPFNTAATLTYIRTISATMLNEARFNFTRFNINEIETSGEANFTVPQISISDFGPGLGLGLDNTDFYGINRFDKPNILTQNTYEFRDTLTVVRGNQALKFGVEARREQDNNNRLSTARPEFTFKNFFNFANDAPFFQEIDVDPRTGGPVNGQRYYRTNSYGAFVQDDWKVRPNLTLNLGLRYEYQSPLTEKEGRLSNYILGPNGIVDGRVQIVDRLHEPDRNNFAPRVGFAWSPARFSDKLVVRGGFGVAYDRLFTNLFTSNRRNPPFFASVNLCCAGVNDLNAPQGDRRIIYSFSSPSSPFLYPVNPLLTRGIDPATGGLLDERTQTLPGGFIRRNIPVEVNGAPQNMPNSYVYNYSLELQYQLPYNVVASVGYQGSTGHKLIRTVDLNRFYPGDTFNCVGCENRKDEVQEADANGNRVTPRLTGNPNFDRIFFPLPDVNSSYNAMNLRVTRQYARGLQLEGIYRWSKSIDTSSFGRGAQQTDPSNPKLNRGPSDFDVRHNFVLSGLWDLPLFRGRTDFIGKALGGFQINGILTLHSGFPWTPQQGCCFFDRPGDFANDANGDGKGNDFPTQYFGGAVENPSNQDFINGLFPNGGRAAFGVIEDCNDFPVRCVTTLVRGPAGVGRNSFRGPNYRSLDLSIVKQTGLPSFLKLGEASNLEVRANFFNVLNLLNLPSFQAGGRSNTDFTNRTDFGRALFGLSGRVVELQARFSF